MRKIKELYFGGTKTAGFNKTKKTFWVFGFFWVFQSQQQAFRESRISNITVEHFNIFIFTLEMTDLRCFPSKSTRNL